MCAHTHIVTHLRLSSRDRRFVHDSVTEIARQTTEVHVAAVLQSTCMRAAMRAASTNVFIRREAQLSGCLCNDVTAERCQLLAQSTRDLRDRMVGCNVCMCAHTRAQLYRVPLLSGVCGGVCMCTSNLIGCVKFNNAANRSMTR